MNLIQVLLLESLRNRNFQLDLQGSDERILNIASKDFMNYMRFHWKLTGQERMQHECTVRIRRYLHEKPGEFKEFLNIWFGIWIRKWDERVKLVTKTEESRRLRKKHERLSQVEPIWKRLSQSEIKDMIVEALIRNGEICGASILAEHLLKTELASRIERRRPTNSLEDLLGIANRVLARARYLSRNRGKTIFIIIEKPRLT